MEILGFIPMTQLSAMLLSILLETPVALGLARWRGCSSPVRSVVLASVLGTCLTHPLVWPGFFYLTPLITYGGAALVLEVGAALVESLVYHKMVPAPPSTSLLMGFGANGFSFGLGQILNALSAP